jgi:hypothetical protein
MQRKHWIGFGVVALIVVILLLSNPSRETHVDAIREQQSSVAGAGIAIAADALGAFEYNNYGIFSTVSSDEDTISFGMLANVWVDEDDR